jgi:hypothetical protein
MSDKPTSFAEGATSVGFGISLFALPTALVGMGLSALWGSDLWWKISSSAGIVAAGTFIMTLFIGSIWFAEKS